MYVLLLKYDFVIAEVDILPWQGFQVKKPTKVTRGKKRRGEERRRTGEEEGSSLNLLC